METFYTAERDEWRNWLAANYHRCDEIWLVYPNKSSEKPRLLYNDAVEEALCFGWIDSIYKRLDAESTVQRFSPRKKGSTYSQANKERLRWLAEKELLLPSIRESVDQIIREEFIFPEDIIEKLRDDSPVWSYYQKFSESYKRIRIAYIEAARKRPEEFEKRLTNFIEKTRANQMIRGFGGIEKYY